MLLVSDNMLYCRTFTVVSLLSRHGATYCTTRPLTRNIPSSFQRRQKSAKSQSLEKPPEVLDPFTEKVTQSEKYNKTLPVFSSKEVAQGKISGNEIFRKKEEKPVSVDNRPGNSVSASKSTEDVPDTQDQKLRSIQEVMWKEVKLEKGQLLGAYLQLSKARLTGLVVATAVAGYLMAPGAFHLGTFACCVCGTALVSAAANGINQWLEVPYDSQMNRTRNRPVVRAVISPMHAVLFSITSATVGLGLLSFTTVLTTCLGLLNLGLYTMVYTPSKRLSIVNTWLGSIVGAIPPVMGWAAATGTLDAGALLLGGLLYAWQFPHFNALSWNLRGEYSRAGYPMMCVTRPDLCRATSLRYSVAFTVLCLLAAPLEVSTWTFAVDSLPFNLYLVMLAANFYKKSDSGSARRLFQFSLVHLPSVLLLLLISKNRDKENDANCSSIKEPL